MRSAHHKNASLRTNPCRIGRLTGNFGIADGSPPGNDSLLVIVLYVALRFLVLYLS